MTTTSDFLRHLRTVAARQVHAALSDQQLLERFLHERSEASFAALVQRHGPMVLSVCRRVLHHAQDAEDAFQATFLILARQANSIRKRESLSSWLHGVAQRSAVCLRAKARRRAAHERRIDPPPPGDAMDDITWCELRSVLDEELQRLPEQYRAPLVLCYLEARTQDEAARQLGWSKNTFARRMNQARQLLARRLTRRGLTLPAALAAPLLIDCAVQAALPPLLAASTIRAGLATAMGQAVGTLVSAQVAALVEGGAASMLVKKVGLTVVVLISLMLGLGGGLVHRTVQDRSSAEAPPAPPQPVRNSSKDRAIDIKGRVLDPDGKPLTGARLFLLSAVPARNSEKRGHIMTDREGRFHFTAQPADFDNEGNSILAATAKGFGPDWIQVKREKQDAVTLRLVKDDVPIEGRVLDLEGKAIPGVHIRVVTLHRGDLDAWIKGTLAKRHPQLPDRIRWEMLGESASIVTGKDGRFRLTGFGRDRVVYVHLRGDKIEASDFELVTRLNLPAGLHKGDNGEYPARFDHVAGPSKPIVGTVRDKRTGKPLAGIRVVCPVTSSWLRATTDAQGRYRISGVGKHQQYWVAAGGFPYFNCTKFDIADTPGLEPITVDFALERGIPIRGKLLDKVTGKPIRGRVSYLEMPDNPNLKDFTDINKPQALAYDPGTTEADGSFAVVAVPGPGLLVATATERRRYLPALIPEPKPSVRYILEEYHAIVSINPSEKEKRSTTQNLYLEPAQTVNGTIIGPDRKPLAGAHYAGLTGTLGSDFGRPPMMETASFTAGGVNSKRTRNIVFVHAGKKLAKIQRIGGETANPLTVRLEPLGAVTGRILDAAGKPRAGLKVAILYSNEKKNYDDLPIELMYHYPSWSKILNREATTDAEGRFRAEGLVPGLKYYLNVKYKEEIVPSLTRMVGDIESGQTKDLGDLKSK